jgi:hypothetical protein
VSLWRITPSYLGKATCRRRSRGQVDVSHLQRTNLMHNSRFVVDHIRQTAAKPFDEVRPTLSGD